MYIINLDTDNEQDMHLMEVLIAATKKIKDTVKEKVAPTPHGPSPSLRPAIKPTAQINDPPRDSLARTLTITSKQAESVMGATVANIRRNCIKISGYKNIIAPHPTDAGSWILGAWATKEMREQDIDTLRSGDLLKVPRLLTTQKINQCIKSIDPIKPPKYRPWTQIIAEQLGRDHVKTFTCNANEGFTYYVTLIDGFAAIRPRYHMAIENFFLKRTL